MTTRRVLRGGLVADGIGSAVARADVLIEDDRIVAVEAGMDHLDAEIINLRAGSVVCPGFIDAHVHAEDPLVVAGWVRGALAQGVTTLVIGQDGSSWIGAGAATEAYLSSYFAPVNGPAPAVLPRVADFTGLVAGRLVQNVAVLASQGTIRHNVAGSTDRPLDDRELAAARAEVEQSLVDGAVGLSSGLDYVPSRFGSPEELAMLCAPLSRAGLPYVSHLRGYGGNVRAGLAELALVGRQARVPVHASHLWGTPADIDAALDQAAGMGVELTFDMYPYLRSSTILAMLVLPPRLLVGGMVATLRRLADVGTRRALLDGEQFSAGYLDRIVLGAVPAAQARHAGHAITRAASGSGKSPGEWTLDLLLDSELQVGAHLDRPQFSEADLHWIVSHPQHAAGSDGIYRGQHPHPRANGAFARLAQHYLDPAGRPDYQRLVRHLSTRAADTYHLASRGRLAPGKVADICVLEPGGLVDTATYERPNNLAGGVALVLTNGTPVWRDGELVAGVRPGVVAAPNVH